MKGAPSRPSDPQFAHAEACYLCGATEGLHLEHILPLSKGGTNFVENLTSLCGPCNLSKGTKGPQGWAEFVAWFNERRGLG
jgi:5-methylcytosine-specific restriction endonuclease McrA